MTEQVDLYTEDGQITGKTASRELVHQLGLWHKTAQLWILNSHNELLLQFRSPEKDCFPSRWDVSSAGHIPAGCDILDSLQRELHEELGLFATTNEFQKLFSIKEKFICPTTGSIDNEIAEVYLLRRDIEISELKFTDKEVTDAKWIPLEKLWESYLNKKDNFVPHEQQFKMLNFELVKER